MFDAGIKPAQVPNDSVNIDMRDFHINSESVMKCINALSKLQKVLLAPNKVKETIFKLKKWYDSFEGNEEEAAGAFLMGKLVEAFMSASSANSDLTE